MTVNEVSTDGSAYVPLHPPSAGPAVCGARAAATEPGEREFATLSSSARSASLQVISVNLAAGLREIMSVLEAEVLLADLDSALLHSSRRGPVGTGWWTATFEILVDELLDFVADHPDRDRLTRQGIVVLHQALLRSRPDVEAVPPGAVEAQTSGPAERRRLAREVHDWVGGALSLVLHRLELFELDAASGDATATRHVALARQGLEEAMAATRQVLLQLRWDTTRRPLREEIADFARRVNLGPCNVAITVTGDDDLSPAVRAVALLVVQEALLNAFRHAQAALVEVEVKRSLDSLEINVRDDGIGVSMDNGARRLGIVGMRERVEEVGGLLCLIRRNPGTQIRGWIPIAGRHDD